MPLLPRCYTVFLVFFSLHIFAGWNATKRESDTFNSQRNRKYNVLNDIVNSSCSIDRQWKSFFLANFIFSWRYAFSVTIATTTFHVDMKQSISISIGSVINCFNDRNKQRSINHFVKQRTIDLSTLYALHSREFYVFQTIAQLNASI